MGRRWQWETKDSERGVELDDENAVLRWWGQDKPRPGVSEHDLAGGEKSQPLSDLLLTKKPAWACPPEILAEVMSAAAAWRPRTADRPRTAPPSPAPLPAASTTLKLAPLRALTEEQTLAACRAAIATLTGDPAPLDITRRAIAEREFPDDRPTQSSAMEYDSEIRLGARVTFLHTAFVGGWSQGEYTWKTDDFAGSGPLRMSFDAFRTELEGAPEVIALLAGLLTSR